MIITKRRHLSVFWIFPFLLSAAHRSRGCPASCTCLGGFVTCFNFTESTLLTLPVDSDTVVLNGGRIRTFPSGFLGRLSHINLLDVQSSNVEAILNGSFAVNGLQQLAISDCTIGTLQEGAFSRMYSVKKLVFSSSRVERIRSGAFAGLNSLDELSMSSNQIARVEQRAFVDLSNILAFSFCRNNVTSLALNAFEDFGSIRQIDISYNSVMELADNFVDVLAAPVFEFSFHSNQFPCHCKLMEMFLASSMIRFLSQNRCVNGTGGITNASLSDFAASDVCKKLTAVEPALASLTTSQPRLVRASRAPEVTLTLKSISATPSTKRFASYHGVHTAKPIDVPTTIATTNTSNLATSADAVQTSINGVIHKTGHGMGNAGSRLHRTACVAFIVACVAPLVLKGVSYWPD